MFSLILKVRKTAIRSLCFLMLSLYPLLAPATALALRSSDELSHDPGYQKALQFLRTRLVRDHIYGRNLECLVFSPGVQEDRNYYSIEVHQIQGPPKCGEDTGFYHLTAMFIVYRKTHVIRWFDIPKARYLSYQQFLNRMHQHRKSPKK
jgi:hypothetical protein